MAPYPTATNISALSMFRSREVAPPINSTENAKTVLFDQAVAPDVPINIAGAPRGSRPRRGMQRERRARTACVVAGA
jgi:hypothetical protein